MNPNKQKKGRPERYEADYFPHQCHHSKTLEIFVEEYGNEGYAFFYRLQEVLGITKGHGYCATGTLNMSYLCKKTGIKEEERLQEMIKFLCELGEIDKKRWEDDEIIWWPNFVEVFKKLYSRRKVDLPTFDVFNDLGGN